MTCPRCPGVMLSRRALDYVSVEDCGRCGGAFLTARALESVCADLALYEAVRGVYPKAKLAVTPPGPMYVRCPGCGEIMNRRQFADGAGIVLDVCRLHGTWLDHGELRAVVDFVESGGYAEERRRETQRRFEASRVAVEQIARMRQEEASSPRRRGRFKQALVDLLTFWV